MINDKKRSWTSSVQWQQQRCYWLLLGQEPFWGHLQESAQLLSGPGSFEPAPIMCLSLQRPHCWRMEDLTVACAGDRWISHEASERRISSWVPGMPRELQGTRSRGNTSHRNQSGHQRSALGATAAEGVSSLGFKGWLNNWGEIVLLWPELMS